MSLAKTLEALFEEQEADSHHLVQYTFLKKYLKGIKPGDADGTFTRLVSKELERVKLIITNR